MQLLDHALFYESGGFSVIPVNAVSKKPFVEWAKYQKQRASVDEIRVWWGLWPEAGIGIVTGEISGVVVVDAENGADFSLFGLDEIETPTVKTGGGGRHWWFAYTPLKNSTRFAPLYDTRGDGGYVLAPPSAHKSGNTYEWLIPLGSVPLRELPESVPNQLNKPAGSVASILSKNISSGSRNQSAAIVIGAVLRRFQPLEWQDKAWPLIQAWNRDKAKPPLDDKELQAIFESIGKAETNRRETEGSGNVTFDKDEFLPDLRLENDSVIIKMKAGDGIVVFRFDEIGQTRNYEILTELTTTFLVPGSEPKPFTGRLNILSMDAREKLARVLTNSFGNINSEKRSSAWHILLSTATTALREHLQNRDESVGFDEVFPETEEYLLEPYLTDKAANLFFGMGSSGKTYLALRMALTCATGLPFLDAVPTHHTNVLYVDYEATASKLTMRLLALMQDNGIRGESALAGALSRFRYLKPPGAVPDCLPLIKKLVKKHDVGLIIIDSAAPALGGKPEDAEAVGGYFRALNGLGVTTLTIAHETKAENKNFPFGSVFWFNLARNVWNFQRKSDEDSPAIVSCLAHRKANDDRQQKPRAAKITFGDGFVNVTHASTEEFPDEESLPKRIRRALRDGPLEINGIAEAIGWTKKSNQLISNALNTGKKNNKFKDQGGLWFSANPGSD